MSKIMRPLNLLVLLAVVAGIVLRFSNLDFKPYWNDEVYTSMHISGYSFDQVADEVFTGEVITKNSLVKYLHPSAEKTGWDTIQALARTDSQHPPLYYVAARLWAQLFGSSVAAMRCFPAILSLLILPAMYWLAMELFHCQRVAAIAVALVSLSPLHLLYAQEARQYSLWLLLSVLSCALLLWSIRRSNPWRWSLYALSVTASLYTFPFTVFTMAVHGLYSLYLGWSQQIEWRQFVGYVGASLFSLMAFAPWLYVMMTNISGIQATTSWTKTPVLPTKILIHRWFISFGLGFADLNILKSFDVGVNLTSFEKQIYLVNALLLVVIVGALYRLLRMPELRNTVVFLILLLLISWFPLAVSDILLGGSKSAIPRYLLPCYISLHVIVAFVLNGGLAQGRSVMTSKFCRLGLAGCLAIGLMSCLVLSTSQNWWHRANRMNFPIEFAERVNRDKMPRIISDDDVGDVLALSYLLDDDVDMLLVKDGVDYRPAPGDVTDKTFLYKASVPLRATLMGAGAVLEEIQAPTQYWQGSWQVVQE
ncbi:glycosyltransferase family 39 protein [Leptothoe spongobia]|uniref:Glycosyltransferase family 39 protein n=1 Tax=Leptothoe spongobia TAU-MAC 1115 TaxID=1967444 RepID=A0A947DID8_9CYAN|nr:glycosyltransferase family 39 protein [Leptothoe spongobia]MBT9317522.1 glycosyltransferase family 39 protein [Leptothoe spongobia TAU-MAC 1115]